MEFNAIIKQVKHLIERSRRSASPEQSNSFHDTVSDNADEMVGNPIVDLYNRALTHPVTTIGLLAAGIGVAAALAFIIAEKQAHKGIDRELARSVKRRQRKLRAWAEDEITPGVKRYRRRYGKKLRWWMK